MATPIEVTREMLKDLNLTEEELNEIRDIFDIFAETVIDQWIEKYDLIPKK